MAGKEAPIVISTTESDTDSSVIFSNNRYFVPRTQQGKVSKLPTTDSSTSSRNSDETIRVVPETG